ncbi:MAG: ATP-binding protein [bacterium]
MERKFKRAISSLDDIFQFIGEFSRREGVDESLVFTINLVVEELFTNMVKYNRQNSNKIAIDLKLKKNDLLIHLTDFDVEPFDITKADKVDTGKTLQERKVGGLGIHLVKKMVDKIDYEYRDRQSKIILTKHLEN